MTVETSGTTPQQEGKTATIIYALYLVALVIGVTSIIGLVMAYIYRDDAPHWLRTHYQYQIRTFWIGLLYVVIGVITSFIFVGYFILLFWFVWYIVRCVKGLKLVSEGAPIANAATWWF